jgi:hypothetical protein
MKKDTDTLLTFLIILSLLTFTRSLVYVIFTNGKDTITQKTGMNIEKLLDHVLFIFSVIRLSLALIILKGRGVHHDILTYVLFFLVLSSIERFYYFYLQSYYPNSKEKKYLDDYQNLNTILVFLSSLYIMKFVFFS